MLSQRDGTTCQHPLVPPVNPVQPLDGHDPHEEPQQRHAGRDWLLNVDCIANVDLLLCHDQASAIKACSHARKTQGCTRNKVID